MFDHGRIIWIRLGSSRSSEPKSLVESNRGFVVARDHQQQDTGVATSGPVENAIHQQTAETPLAMCRRCPHGNEVGTRRIILIEKGAGDAARRILVHREEPSSVVTIPPFHTLHPIRVGELNLLRICRAECQRGILESAKANSFEEEGVQRRDWLDSDQRKFNPEMSVLIASRTMHRVYYRATPRLCFESVPTFRHTR